MSVVLSVAYVILAAAGAGRWLTPRMPQSLRPVERIALQVLGGLAILGLALFLIGNLRLSPAIIAWTLAAPAAFGAWHAKSRVTEPRPSGRSPSLGALCTAAILLVVLISAFDLPIGASDDVSYHLLGPSLWLREGSVHIRPDNFATSFPATVEMLFAAVMGLSNSRAPGLLSFVFTVILLLQTWGLAKRLGASDSVARLAVLLGAGMPALMDQAGLAYVDIPLACFALAAARIVFDRANRTHLAAGALFVGAAVGTKYTGLFVLAATVIAVLLPASSAPPVRRRWADAALLSLAACAFGSAWYIRNFIHFGTPIYPPPALLAHFVTVKGMRPSALQSFQSYMLDSAGGQFGRGPLAFFLLPFRLTYNFPAFWGWKGALGIAPLAFVPLAIIALRRSDFARTCLVWALILTICWFLTAQISRYLLPVLALLPALSAIGAAAVLRQPAWSARALAWAVIAVSLVHGSYTVAAQHWTRLRDVLSPTYAAATRAADPRAKVFDYLNARPEVRSVLILDRFVKPYYLHKTYLMIRGEYGEQPIEGVSDFPSALPHLRQLGATHLLDVRSPDTGFAVQPDPSLTLVLETPDARIFRVQPAALTEPRASAN